MTSVESNNKTVNLTAKSDIYGEVISEVPQFIISNGDSVSATYAGNGTWWAVYTFDDYAEYNVSASYPLLDSLAVANAAVVLTRADSTLVLDNVVMDYMDSVNVTVTAAGATGITAMIDGKEVNVTGYTIPISGLNAGTHALEVTTVPDADHNSVSRTVNIIVNKLKTQLAADSVTATYNINKYLVITLKDAKGNALANIKVSVDLNGVKEYVTDNNGQIKVATQGLAPQTYTAKITFMGNTNYEKSFKDVKVTVKKATPKLTAKKKTFKKAKKVKKYIVTLKSNVGKAMKKVKLTIKVGKKTYTAKTNAKGQATFKLKKLSKKGKYTAVVTYKGDKFYNKVTKKVKITVK